MVSPFLEHLDTNYSPSYEDIPRIQKIIQENTSAAAAIDREIGPLLLTVAGLIKRRMAHADFASRHASLLGPIRRIPDDVLSVIFGACLPSSDDSKQPPMSRTHPAVVLSHVCRRWRQLSISTPTLWTSIVLALPIHPAQGDGMMWHSLAPGVHREAGTRWEARMEDLHRTCKVWLARSAEAPLSILLWGTTPWESLHQEATARISGFISLLCGAAHRWRVVDICLALCTLCSGDTPQERTVVALSALTNLRPADIPLLVSLRLRLESGAEWQANLRSMVDHESIHFLRAPALHSLRLDTIICPWRSMDVDWSSLTHLHFGGYARPKSAITWGSPSLLFDWVDAFLLLSECARLITCDLAIPHAGSNDARVLSRYLTLPSLESLTLRGFVPDERFLDSVDLPSLRNLRYAGPTRPFDSSDWGPEQAGVFAAWLRRFGHQVHSVSFEFPNLSDDALYGLLKGLHVVESLDIVAPPPAWGTNGEQVANFAAVLMPNNITAEDEPMPSLCPKLKRLHLNVALDGTVLDEEGILKMIAARRVRVIGEELSLIDEVHIDFGVTQTMDIPMELQVRNVDVEDFRFTATYIPPVPLVTFSPD